MQENGIEPRFVLELSDTDLTQMNVDDSGKALYHTKAEETLNSIREKPIDVFEWRAANRRLCDFWVIPMFLNPTFGLLWSRFFDNDKIIEMHDNEVDQITSWSFWLSWFLCPSRPFYVVSFKFMSDTVVDDHLRTLLMIQFYNELASFLVVIYLRYEGRGERRKRVESVESGVWKGEKKEKGERKREKGEG